VNKENAPHTAEKPPGAHSHGDGKIRRGPPRGKIEADQMKKLLLLIAGLIISVTVIWSAFTYYSLQQPLQEIIASDNSFEGIRVEAKYGGFLKKDVLIFNLKKVPGKAELISPFRIFYDFIIRMENDGRRFSKIKIQYKGRTKYIIDGERIHGLTALEYIHKDILKIGLEFPNYLQTPGGRQAFVAPSGDFQYVQQKKLHNFDRFVEMWFLEDMKKKAEKAPKKSPAPKKTKKGKKTTVPTDIPEIPNKIPDSKTPGGKISPPEKPGPKPTDIDSLPPIEPEQI